MDEGENETCGLFISFFISFYDISREQLILVEGFVVFSSHISAEIVKRKCQNDNSLIKIRFYCLAVCPELRMTEMARYVFSSVC